MLVRPFATRFFSLLLSSELMKKSACATCSEQEDLQSNKAAQMLHLLRTKTNCSAIEILAKSRNCTAQQRRNHSTDSFCLVTNKKRPLPFDTGSGR